MEIYQGEPFMDSMKFKDGESYVSDLSSYVLEALLKNAFGRVLKTWSTESGTITKTVVSGVGYASFGMTGEETAWLDAGDYTLEIAKVITGGRAIGISQYCLTVKAAKIKNGVS